MFRASASKEKQHRLSCCTESTLNFYRPRITKVTVCAHSSTNASHVNASRRLVTNKFGKIIERISCGSFEYCNRVEDVVAGIS